MICLLLLAVGDFPGHTHDPISENKFRLWVETSQVVGKISPYELIKSSTKGRSRIKLLSGIVHIIVWLVCLLGRFESAMLIWKARDHQGKHQCTMCCCSNYNLVKNESFI
jgi:hypothetical protein